MPPKTDLTIIAATSGHSGVDTVIRNLLPEFAKLGLRVDVITIKNHGPYLGSLPENCRNIKLDAKHIETSLPGLIRYLREERPKAILSDKDRVNRVSLLARSLSGVSCRVAVRLGTTVSVNLKNKGFFQAAFQRSSIRLLYKLANSVIVPSQGVADDLSGIMRVPAEKLSVLPNPIINQNLYRAAEQPLCEQWLQLSEAPLIVAVGSLTARKDYQTLIEAFSKLRSEMPARLALIGDGPCRDELENQAIKLGVRDEILFAGYQENPYPWIARADVFAHTSRWEGLGIVLVEALALGTPVVSTNCPSGPAEILGNGRYGHLVPIGDTESLASNLALVIKQGEVVPPNVIDRFNASTAAREYVEEIFNGPRKTIEEG